MIDIKKLITGFLILAVAASASALLLTGTHASSVSGTAAAQTADVGQQIAILNATTTPLETNALNVFVPQTPAAPVQLNPSDYENMPLVDPSSTDDNNLTDVLADAYMNGVMQANPSGPQDDSSGNPDLNDPDTSAIAVAVASDTNLASLERPDWDIEADSQPIKVAATSSPASIQAYSTALSDVMDEHFVSTGAVNTVSADNPDSGQDQQVETEVQQALGDTLALQVPQSLVGFQKSVVTMMVYEKNMLALAASSTDDPVKTALLMQDESGNYQAALANLQIQMQSAATLNGFSFGTAPLDKESAGMAFVDSMFGIQSAHAQYLTFDASNFGEWILKFAQDLGLQILKNTLITIIQRKVLVWVQGSGAPRFVTQWGTSLVNAYTAAAVNAINANMACIYGPFAAQTRLDLNIAFGTQSDNVCYNTFQRALGGSTLQQFYNNFSSGGMVAFNASLLPSGNQFGSELFAAQTVGLAGQNSQTSVSAKLTSSQGLTGDQVCDDGSNPGGIHYECQNPDGKDYDVGPNEKCDPSDTQVAQANDGDCADGTEPKTTTPGTFTGFGVSSALDSSPKLVTAANSVAGILSAVLGSLMTTLAQTAISAANSAVNQGISGLSQSSISSNNPPAPAPIPLACNPPTQTASTSVPISMGATGGANDTQGNPPIYSWTSSDGATSSNYVFSHAYATPGNYTVSLSDNTGDATTTCSVTVQ